VDKLYNEEEKTILSSGSAVSIVTGIILIVISIMIMTNPGTSVLLLTTLLGIYLLIKGVFDLFTSFSSKTKNRGLTVFSAIVGILAGVFIVANPLLGSVVSVVFFVWMIAFALIISGILSMMDSVGMGILSIIIGILLLFASSVGVAAVFIWLLGFLVLFLGIFSIIAGAKLNFEAKKIG
jgi:uncharacterized membrane protein HdeD (DUF308 family)